MWEFPKASQYSLGADRKVSKTPISQHVWASVVGTVTAESNDYFAFRYWILKKSDNYFATRYWAMKKVTIISLLITGLLKKYVYFVTHDWTVK